LISDVHKLFDTGYPTITNNHKTEVSERIKEEFKNCKEYYQSLVVLFGEKRKFVYI
jgi:putative restriction endonuclease